MPKARGKHAGMQILPKVVYICMKRECERRTADIGTAWQIGNTGGAGDSPARDVLCPNISTKAFPFSQKASGDSLRGGFGSRLGSDAESGAHVTEGADVDVNAMDEGDSGTKS